MKKITALFCLTLASTALADDWPYFLGPTADNVSKEVGLLDAFPKGGPREVFTKSIGTGNAPVSVRDGKVVLFHRASKLLKISPDDTFAKVIAYINGELAAFGTKERVTAESISAAQQNYRRSG